MSNLTIEDKQFLSNLTFDIAKHVKSLSKLTLLDYMAEHNKTNHKMVSFRTIDNIIYSEILQRIIYSLPISGTLFFFAINNCLRDLDIVVFRNNHIELRMTKTPNSKVFSGYEYHIDYCIGVNNGPKI